MGKDKVNCELVFDERAGQLFFRFRRHLGADSIESPDIPLAALPAYKAMAADSATWPMAVAAPKVKAWLMARSALDVRAWGRWLLRLSSS